jgi:hypothetical protein
MDSKEFAIELLESGILTPDVLLNECIQYMSDDDMKDILYTLGYSVIDEEE